MPASEGRLPLKTAPGAAASPGAGQRLWTSVAALTALTAFLVVVGARHAPWFDETQAWMIARRADPAAIVGRWAREEGTPGLWHLLLWALQRLGLPFAAFGAVSGACALGGAAIVLWRAPFPFWLRVGLTFSYWFAYQYAVIARSYALDLLLIPAAATLFEARLARPLAYGAVLGLLANANSFSCLTAAILGAEWAWSAWRARRDLPPAMRGPVIGGLTLCVLAGLAAAAQALPDPHAPYYACCVSTRPYRAAVMLMFALMEPGLITAAAPRLTWNVGHGIVLPWAGFLLLGLVLAPVAILAWRARRPLLVAALLAAPVVMAVTVRGAYHHAGLVLLDLVLGLWIVWPARTRLSRPLRAWLSGALALVAGFGLVDTAAAAIHEFRAPISGGPAAAAFLRAWMRAHPDARVAALGFKTYAVEPYFDREPFANAADADGVYRWGAPGSPIDSDSLRDRRAAADEGYDAILMRSDHWFPDRASPRLIAAQMAAVGYRLERVFPGALFQGAGTQSEDDGLLFFVRQTPARPAAPEPAPGAGRRDGPQR